jgi:hypothetical protein
LAVSICLTGLLMLLGPSADAQQGQYVTQAAKRLAGLIDAGNAKGFRLATNKFSIGGGWLNQSTDWTALFTINLEAGKKYRFLGAGDDDAEDVDVRVMDPAGTQVAIDASVAKTAQVDYTPGKTLRYTVQARVFRSRAGGGGKMVPSLTLATVMVFGK